MSLSDRAITNAKPKDRPYKLSDSQGLYLLINRSVCSTTKAQKCRSGGH
jgi:hypothetical protein